MNRTSRDGSEPCPADKERSDAIGLTSWLPCILLPNNGIFVPYLRGMKQKKQEPDYRSMNEGQLKYELIKFEKKMLEGALKHKTDNPDQQ